MAYKRLGDVLTDAGLITDEQLGHALAQQKESKRRLGDELIAEGVITEAELIEALQMQLGIEFVDLSAIDLDPEMSRVVSKNVARQYNVVPVRTTPEDVYLAMSDPLNFMAIEAVKNATRKRVVPMVATNDSVMRAIMTLYGNEGAARAIEEMKRDARAAGTDDGGNFQTSTLGDDADAQSAPTVRLVNSIIERAATERASDIHLEPREADLHVRMRIDGVLRTILTVPKELQASVISRLKIMGGMNTSERRVPQDGRANIRLKKQDIDLRINTLPTIHGETVVIRLLDKNESLFDPKGIGLAGSNLEKYNRLIHANNGMVLIVGPTGSGKSSTMYTMIRELNDDSVNLVTLEDPVEYNIDGANQVQINEKTGLTFSGLVPGTQYTIEAVALEGKKMSGSYSATASTLAETKILSFTATPISITQAELNFILQDGPDFDTWTVTYETAGTEPKSVSFSGHSVVISDLLSDSEYTFTLQAPADTLLTGAVSTAPPGASTSIRTDGSGAQMGILTVLSLKMSTMLLPDSPSSPGSVWLFPLPRRCAASVPPPISSTSRAAA